MFSQATRSSCRCIIATLLKMVMIIIHSLYESLTRFKYGGVECLHILLGIHIKMASEDHHWQPHTQDPSNDYEMNEFVSHDTNRRQSSNWKRISVLIGCSILQLPIWGM